MSCATHTSVSSHLPMAMTLPVPSSSLSPCVCQGTAMVVPQHSQLLPFKSCPSGQGCGEGNESVRGLVLLLPLLQQAKGGDVAVPRTQRRWGKACFTLPSSPGLAGPWHTTA